MTTDIPLPKDPRHQRVADLVLAGHRKGEAYSKVYPRAGKAGRNSLASRVLNRRDVVAYMTAIQARAAEGSVLTVMEKREFLARTVRCRIMNEPDDSDLWQEFRIQETDMGSTIVRKLMSKAEAIKIDNALSGDDPEANAIESLSRAIAELGKKASTLPTDKL